MYGAARSGKLRLLSFDGRHELVVRLVLGATLLVAAGLKARLPLPDMSGSFISPWLAWPLIVAEGLLGAWLLSGLFARAARLVAMVFFAAFAAVSLFKAVSGAESCGCFGGMPTNPWLTLCFDVSAVVALRFSAGPLANRTAGCIALDSWQSVAAGTTTILALALIVSGARQVWATAERPFEVLEPTTWMNERLPILDQIDIGDELAVPLEGCFLPAWLPALRSVIGSR